MSPVQSNVKPTNDHSYPAYDYPVGIGTGLVACKPGVIRDMPGVPTRALMSPLQNGQAWPKAGGGSPNSGNVITIDHGNNEFTCYLHVSPYNVSATRGKTVQQGGVFHKSGNNGWSTGPHLHFEVWKNGVRIDPGPWLANIKQGGTMSSQVPADETTIRLAYNNGLLRNATQAEVNERIAAKQTVETVQRSVINSAEHHKVQELYALGKAAQTAGWKPGDPVGGDEYVETKVYVKKGSV